MNRTYSSLALISLAASLGTVAACSDDPPLPEGPEVHVAEREIPAISGGTLAVSKSGALAVAADPDRDRILVVDLATKTVEHEIALERFDEPGRIIEDDAGRFHVLLRRAGALVTVDAQAGAMIGRVDVCASPRGVDHHAPSNNLYIACAGGELVEMSADTREISRWVRMKRDLRDVVAQDNALLVSRFRSAEVLVIDISTLSELRTKRPASSDVFFSNFEPAVAWRLVEAPDGAMLVHQRAFSGEIPQATQAYYAGVGCENSVVESTVTPIRQEAIDDEEMDLPPTVPLMGAVLPVDVAVGEDGRAAVVAAGSGALHVVSPDNITDSAPCSKAWDTYAIEGGPIAVAITDQGPIVQTRSPSTLVLLNGDTIPLGGDELRDTGHDLFHQPPGEFSQISCASCHPEGGEDARVWTIDGIGARRTQTLRGGILATAPLHWDGTLGDMHALTDEVMVKRMAGHPIGPRYVEAMQRWMDTVPATRPSPSADDATIARGKELFQRPDVGCADCHNGPMLTDNENHAVGVGPALQTPSLVGLAERAPFMHDGCAPTLHDRFNDTACGGGDQHGQTSQLSSGEIDDLVAYLESL